MDSRKSGEDYGIELDEKQEDNKSDEWFDLDTAEPRTVEKTPTSRPINKNMMISEIVEEHPDIVPEIMNRGMHCVGCGSSSLETLEEGFMNHGMDNEEIDRAVDELNKIIEKNSKPERRPEDLDDFF